MKSSEQRVVSRQHCSVVITVWENELREILKQSVFSGRLPLLILLDPSQMRWNDFASYWEI
jgi:hypothetical protein